MLTGRLFLTAFATLALSCAANAASINLFNTGVDAGGTPLPQGTVGDPHYSLISVPDGTTNILILNSTGGFPVGPWLGDNLTSSWIGPNNDLQADGGTGNFDYQTTFDLTGFDPLTALLGGLWATDNPGVDILINGVSTGNVSCCYTDWTAFSVSSGFVAGVNTLDFIVQNQGGPTGLRVEMSGTVNPADPPSVPEPASLLLIGAGLVALPVIKRRVRI